MSEFEVKVLERLDDIRETINDRADEIRAQISISCEVADPNYQPFVNEERWD